MFNFFISYTEFTVPNVFLSPKQGQTSLFYKALVQAIDLIFPQKIKYKVIKILVWQDG